MFQAKKLRYYSVVEDDRDDGNQAVDVDADPLKPFVWLDFVKVAVNHSGQVFCDFKIIIGENPVGLVEEKDPTK